MATRLVELVAKNEFAAIALKLENKTFVVYIEFLNNFVMSLGSTPLDVNVYLFRRSYIAKFIVEKAFTKIFNKYSNFVDVFLPYLAFKLPEHSDINNHAIKPINSQQLPYKLIYSLRLVKLETLKAYIKTNLANKFIRLFKSPTRILILFEWKLDRFFRLYINYQGLNSLTIKNW